MFFNEKSYTPGNFDDEVFLTDFPIEIIENSITAQFNDPFEFRNRDYLQTFFSQYDYSINNCTEDENDELEEYHDNFIQFLLNKFNEKLSISIPNIEDKVDSEVHEIIHIIYRFFIINIKRNFSNYIYNYIQNHMDEIESLFAGEKRKDVTTNSFKEDAIDEHDMIVLVHLPKIVSYVIENISPAYEFLNLCVDDTPSLETTYVTEKFNAYDITGNFSKAYSEMLSEDAISDISSDIRFRILKNYPSRYAIYNPTSEPETEESTTPSETTSEAEN